jgi:hypothetical protein
LLKKPSPNLARIRTTQPREERMATGNKRKEGKSNVDLMKTKSLHNIEELAEGPQAGCHP